jgi:hypothetical protein
MLTTWAVCASATVHELAVAVIADLNCGDQFSIRHSVMGFYEFFSLSSSPFLLVILEGF